MRQSNEVQRDLRSAKISAWLDKNVIAIATVCGLMGGCAIGASGMAIADRTERLSIAKRHDDEIRDFRQSCRRTVDERDGKVLEATTAAKNAAIAAAEATQAAAQATGSDEPKQAPPTIKPKVTRSPAPDLNAAVRDVNKRIAEDAKK